VKGMVALALLAAALAGVGGGAAPRAAARPPQPAELTVAGGEDAWHPGNSFELGWTNREPAGSTRPDAGASPLAAVAYRLRDPLGIAIDEARLYERRERVSGLTVPDVPGVYSVEVWLEDTAGERGPASVARLRFDDVRPGPIAPFPVPAWIGRTAFPLTVRLGHPLGPPPVSGIRGYAVEIAAAPGRDPCAAPDRCVEDEVALHGGVEDDALTIGALPEGANYLRAVAVSGSGMKSTRSSGAVLRVDTTDPVTELAGVPLGWVSHPVTLIATATDGASGMQPAGAGSPPFTAIRVDGGVPTAAPGDTAVATVIGEGVHRVAYYARDAAGNVDDGGVSNGIPNRPPRTAAVRIDREPPSLAFANTQDPDDPDLLRVEVVDSLSGPDPARGRIGVRPVGSSDAFDPLPPAPAAGGELRARWDSDARPAGEYEFAATGYDLAGNATSTARRANGTPMILSNPLKTSTVLGADLGGRAPRTVAFGRGLRLEGRLGTAGGGPLAGKQIQVLERFAAGAVPTTRMSTVETGPDGAFSIHLAPGPSREVTASFDGTATLSRAASRPLALRVRGGVRLRTSAAVARVGGAPLVFRGQVEAERGTIPAEGKSVQLQFRLPGLPWAEFRTIETDRRGRFRYAYRFSDDDSRGARFQFRAYAPAQGGWPYEPGGSAPVAVRGL
jgi:hypothetical protein